MSKSDSESSSDDTDIRIEYIEKNHINIKDMFLNTDRIEELLNPNRVEEFLTNKIRKSQEELSKQMGQLSKDIELDLYKFNLDLQKIEIDLKPMLLIGKKPSDVIFGVDDSDHGFVFIEYNNDTLEPSGETVNSEL